MALLVGKHDVEKAERGEQASANSTEEVACLGSHVVGAVCVEGKGSVVKGGDQDGSVGERGYCF